MSQQFKMHKVSIPEEKGYRQTGWQIPVVIVGIGLLVLLMGLVMKSTLSGSTAAEPARDNPAVNPELRMAQRYAGAAAERAAAMSPAVNPELMWAHRYATAQAESRFLGENPEIRLFQRYKTSTAAQLADGRFLAANPEIKSYRYFVYITNK